MGSMRRESILKFNVPRLYPLLFKLKDALISLSEKNSDYITNVAPANPNPPTPIGNPKDRRIIRILTIDIHNLGIRNHQNSLIVGISRSNRIQASRNYLHCRPGIEKGSFGLDLHTGVLFLSRDSPKPEKNLEKLNIGKFDAKDQVKFLILANGSVIIQKNQVKMVEIEDVSPNSSSYFSAYLHGLNSEIGVRVDSVD